jgi:hypothetical protein
MGKKNKHLNDRTLLKAFILVFSYFISSIIIKTIAPPQAAGIAITVLTISALGYFLFRYYRSISSMDEVSIKVQMEAAVISFLLVLLLIMTLGLLQLFISFENWNYRHLVMAFLAFYCIGLFISRSKYNYTDDEEHD